MTLHDTVITFYMAEASNEDGNLIFLLDNRPNMTVTHGNLTHARLELFINNLLSIL